MQENGFVLLYLLIFTMKKCSNLNGYEHFFCNALIMDTV